MMQKIVLTGGPQAGKTTILRALSMEYSDKIVFVPEIASLLLSNGFPEPGKDIIWNETWQAIFQNAILSLQINMEEAYVLLAKQKNISLIICDRGVLDGAAYTPGGVKEFCDLYGLHSQNELEKYNAIIHLESMATTRPSFYGKDGNDVRFEDVERAQDLEYRTRAVWENHPQYHFIAGCDNIVEKIDQVLTLVESILAKN
ncbi:MAG: ATP-binding protein [Candidatus Parcubacteria bacterium]|nr:ATP-binding protein [Candidatus Parcubacteria bacterium]